MVSKVPHDSKRVRLTVEAGLILLAAILIPSGFPHGEVLPFPTPHSETALVLEKVLHGASGQVSRREDGRIVGISVPRACANESDLARLAALPSITRLEIFMEPNSPDAARDLAPLVNFTNLVDLVLVCCGPLTPGAFEKVCGLTNLQSLDLSAPEAPAEEYQSIRKLKGLHRLRINYLRNFDNTCLVELTNLVQLQALEIRGTAVSMDSTNLLIGIGSLTNFWISPRAPQ